MRFLAPMRPFLALTAILISPTILLGYMLCALFAGIFNKTPEKHP